MVLYAVNGSCLTSLACKRHTNLESARTKYHHTQLFDNAQQSLFLQAFLTSSYIAYGTEYNIRLSISAVLLSTV